MLHLSGDKISEFHIDAMMMFLLTVLQTMQLHAVDFLDKVFCDNKFSLRNYVIRFRPKII